MYPSSQDCLLAEDEYLEPRASPMGTQQPVLLTTAILRGLIFIV